MLKMKYLLVLIIVFLFPVQTFAEIINYKCTVKQKIEANQSIESVRLQAVHKAKHDVVQKSVSQIESLPSVKAHRLNQHEILAVAAFALRPLTVVENKYIESNTFGIEININAKVDSDKIENQINIILADHVLIDKISNVQAYDAALLSTIEKIQAYEKTSGASLSIKQKLDLEEKYFRLTQSLYVADLNMDALMLKKNKKYADPEKALKLLALATQLDPGYAASFVNRGIAYFELGMMKHAVGDCNKAITIDSRSTIAYNDRGYIYLETGKLQEAMADFNQSIQLDPNNEVVYANRGIAHKKAGKTGLMCDDLKKACMLGLCEPMNMAVNEGGCQTQATKAEKKAAPKKDIQKAKLKKEPVPVQKASKGDDVTKQMSKLIEMRKKGLISEDEYQSKTNKLIQSLK